MDLSTIKEYLLLFLKYPEDPIKRSRRIKVNSIITLFYGISILFIFIIQCTGWTGEELTNKIVSKIISSWLFFCLISIVILIPFWYALGVLIHWKVPEIITPLVAKENANIIAQEIENRVLQEIVSIQQCEDCKDYKYSRKLLGKYLEEFDTHAKFVEAFPGFKKQSDPKDLDFIIESLDTWKYGKLLCMLVNKEYYEEKKQPDNVGIVTSQRDSLFKYFLCFAGVIKNTKRVKRIFCTSPIINNNTIDEERAKWMFEYILLNVGTGVELCLFNDTDGKARTLPNYHIDYVVGLHPDVNNVLYSKRTLFLSYDEKNSNAVESKVMVCEDQLIANIFEADFYSRLRGKTKSGGVGIMSYDRIPIHIENYKKNTKRGVDYDYQKLSNDLKRLYEAIKLDDDKAQECVSELIDYISNYSEEKPNRDTLQKIKKQLNNISFSR